MILYRVVRFGFCGVALSGSDRRVFHSAIGDGWSCGGVNWKLNAGRRRSQ